MIKRITGIVVAVAAIAAIIFAIEGRGSYVSAFEGMKPRQTAQPETVPNVMPAADAAEEAKFDGKEPEYPDALRDTLVTADSCAVRDTGAPM